MNEIKRTGKFYRNNEAEVMQKYGLKPTANSGSGWIEKEDGENDRYICQLKSTEKDSIKIDLLDLHKLIYHADIAHKIPVFMVQFITQNEEYVIMRAEDAQSLYTAREGMQEYNYTTLEQNAVESVSELLQSVSENTIKSAPKAREKYYREREQAWKRKSK